MLPPGRSTVDLSGSPAWDARLSPTGEFSLDLPSDVKQFHLDVIASPSMGRSKSGKSLMRIDVMTTDKSSLPSFALPPHRTVPFVIRPVPEAKERLSLSLMDGHGGTTWFTPPYGESDLVLPLDGYVVVASTAVSASPLVAFTVDENHPVEPVQLELRATSPFTCELKDADGATAVSELMWVGPRDANGVERRARFALHPIQGRIDVSGLLPGSYEAAFRMTDWGTNDSPPLQVVELREGAILTRPAP